MEVLVNVSSVHLNLSKNLLDYKTICYNIIMSNPNPQKDIFSNETKVFFCGLDTQLNFL